MPLNCRNLVLPAFGLLLIMLSATPANAAVYKCVENGSTVFRDEPCRGSQGERVNLGATIEDDDPTGTRGDVTGSFSVGPNIVNIKDALGVFDRAGNYVSLFLIPGRYSSAEVQHFRDVGTAEILANRPPLDPRLSSSYPYLEIVLAFKPGQPRTREQLDKMILRVHGLQPGEPVVSEQAPEQALPVLRQLSLFEDVAEADIDLAAEQEIDVDGHPVRWQLSIRAPVYYR